MEHSDETLVRLSAQGDEKAFLELIRRYERQIATLIQYSVANPEDAQDVLQETLVDAWIGVRLLREPGKARSWLLQVARNRCRDYYRSSQRRELPTQDHELEEKINRMGPGLHRRRETLAELTGALEQIPKPDREVATLFYLQGFTIPEIAARQQRPEGTVKQRLFYARGLMRQALGVTTIEEATGMTVRRQGAKAQPFPLTRPQITITPSETGVSSVNCPELRWWSVIPEEGQSALTAQYHPLDWKLKSVTELRVVRKARVHELEGVEIDVANWDSHYGWDVGGVDLEGRLRKAFARITDARVQWLATITTGKTGELRTFLNDGFVWAFPEVDRILQDDGLFSVLTDGSLVTTRQTSYPAYAGAGAFQLHIGNNSFTCLRVIGLEDPADDPGSVVTENYVADTGCTVLIRAYCRPDGPGGDRFDLDKDHRLTVNGETFVHWYDQISQLAL